MGFLTIRGTRFGVLIVRTIVVFWVDIGVPLIDPCNHSVILFSPPLGTSKRAWHVNASRS